MNIKLNWIRIENFKGIKNFIFEPNGKNVSIYGDNATGKTSVEDAWRWLLFNKDSNDKEDTNFTIKPQDENGKDIMSTESVVEAELLIDGKPLRLKKARVEDWMKKNNIFKGHKRVYWFDEEPVSATVYQSKINELINETTFKMLTNPLYFNTQIEWKKRRDVLFDVFIKNTDEEIILSNPAISRLAEMLNGKTIESYKAIVSEKLKGLREEKGLLPPKITEVTSSLPQIKPDYTATETELKGHKETLAGIEFILTNATTKANKINEKYQKLAKLNNQLDSLQSKIKADSLADKTKLIEKKTELQGGQYLLSSAIGNLKVQIDQYSRILGVNANTRATLLLTYKELNQLSETIRSKQFDDTSGVATNCPTCEQQLPIETVQNKMAELKANFEKDKKERLDTLQVRINMNIAEGKSIKENTEKTQSDLELVKKELEEKEFNLENISISIDVLNKEISKPTAEPDYTKDAEHNQLIGKIEQLQTELDKPVEDKSAELLQKKSFVQSQIDELNKVLNGKEETEKKKARIEFLKSEQRRVGNLIAELEGHNFLIEEFYVVKIGMVNSNFEHVRFRFFEDNDTNDNKKEMCVAEVNTNGSFVKFEDANLAGQINAGLDIIRFLSNYYEVTATIFIDNRESVSEIIETDSQVVNLIKPPTWNELDAEIREHLVNAVHLGNIEKAKKVWDDRNNTLRVEVEQ